MKTCRWMQRVEALHDGIQDAKTQTHLGKCALCAAHLDRLKRFSAAIAAVRHEATIEDAQFGAFMAGIHEEIAPKPAWRRGFWAMASLSAAALLIALSLWGVFRLGLDPHAMTEVEAMQTELEGASLDWVPADDGVATLWVNVSEDDTW